MMYNCQMKGGMKMNNQGVMMQYFEWYLDNEPHLWNRLKEDASHLQEIGITAIWMPPAFKSIGGRNDVGYGVYDIYDLGEFDQQGTIATKYGTKDEYLECIQTLQEHHIDVYADIVLNHKMGADGFEYVKAYEMNPNNKNEIISSQECIQVPTLFTFPHRHQKYSDFIWDWNCFDGIDYDALSKRHATFLFQDKHWDQNVDHENGNFDYLMGADIDFSNPKVLKELEKWGYWYLDMTHVNGLRLDAVKHIDAYFYRDWVMKMRNYTHQDLFVVGEYWHGDVQRLLYYLKEVNHEISLFDVPLHYHFYEASHSQGQYDMSKIFENTLVKIAPKNAVTFVDNHDTQPSQGLQSWVEDWFKPLAYALILLREEGYPCVFYGDYYGIQSHINKSIQKVIDQLLYIRKHYVFTTQRDYFDDQNIIGWVRTGEKHALACIMSDSIGGSKKMYIGKEYVGKIFVDVLGCCSDEVYIDQEGYGCFYTNGGSVSVYMVKDHG